MFWKNRNATGILILLVASLLWGWGRQAVFDSYHLSEAETTSVIEETTSVIEETSAGVEETTVTTYEGADSYRTSTVVTEITEMVTVEETASTPEESRAETERGRMRALGIGACVLGVLLGITGVFVLLQKKPIIGPDGMCALYFLGSWGYGFLISVLGDAPMASGRWVVVFFFLLSLRILWGWCLGGFSSEWCLLRRLGKKASGEGNVLLLYLAWTILGLVALGAYGFTYAYAHHWIFYGAGTVTIFFGLFFLWKYAMELQHFKSQLENFRRELPVEVKEGTFSQTESQLVQISKAHQEALWTAVKAERFKVDLIANVSHDLRTPLTSILGYSELLEQEELSPKGKTHLTRLREKSVYMNELVESLFELTKVESGALEPNWEQIDLVRLLEQTIGFIEDSIQSSDSRIRRRYAVEELQILSDGSMLHRVFLNLLGNALKYALEGTRIYLDLKEERDSAHIRLVNTANYEMDFSEEEILQRFARGDKARTTQGSGLGLAIAQTYIEALGGTFRIEVDGDRFSAFVTLPKKERDL